MFPTGSDGMPDMGALLQQAQQMQQQLTEAQDALAEARVTGNSGGGLVTATVSGTGDIVGLEISPQAIDPDDTDTLSDLVVAAIRDAGARAKELAAQQLGPLAGGLGGGEMPDLGSMFGGAPDAGPGSDPDTSGGALPGGRPGA